MVQPMFSIVGLLSLQLVAASAAVASVNDRSRLTRRVASMPPTPPTPPTRRPNEPRNTLGIRRLPNGVRHAMAAAASGAAGVTLLAPVEIVRVNMMLTKQPFIKALSSLRAGWFRGNSADALAAAMRVGITMPAYAMFKQALVRISGGDELQPMPRWATFTAGALAGCTATIICFPLEVVRTRAAAGCDIDNVAACLVTLADTEGFLSLYGGLATTLAGVLPFNAIKLASYDFLRDQALRQRMGAARPAPGSAAAQRISLPPATTAAIAAWGGVLAATSCFPLEVVRRRQMMGEFVGLSVPRALSALSRKEGVAALMAGANLNIVKVAIGNSIGFVLYEAFMDVLQVHGRSPPWEKKRT